MWWGDRQHITHIRKQHTYVRSRRISVEQTNRKRPILVFISCDPKNKSNIYSAAGKSCFHENAGSLYGHFPRNVWLEFRARADGTWACVVVMWAPLLLLPSMLAHLRLSPLHWPASPAESLLFYAPALRQHTHIYFKIEILLKPNTKLSQNGYTLHYGQHNYELLDSWCVNESTDRTLIRLYEISLQTTVATFSIRLIDDGMVGLVCSLFFRRKAVAQSDFSRLSKSVWPTLKW